MREILFKDFNPRSRVGNDVSIVLIVSNVWNFNPRSRVGNDCISLHYGQSSLISIHVPAWGTTRYLLQKAISVIFQSTFPRGERLVAQAQTALLADFNPRSRVGNDDKRILFLQRISTISIHVPAWGTTCGVDHGFSKIKFQSTFPRGERQHHTI